MRSKGTGERRRGPVVLDVWYPAFLGGPGVGTGVEPSNFKIGFGVGSGIAGVDGANFEIGTPDPGCAKSSDFEGFRND